MQATLPRTADTPDLRRRQLLLLASGMTLAGCGSTPKPPVQLPSVSSSSAAAAVAAAAPAVEAALPLAATRLAITIKALADINPDIRGNASPLALRIFELKSATAFESADFFALYDREQAALGAELLASAQLTVKPMEIRTLTRDANLETRYLGIVAAIRELERSVWRQIAAVAPPMRTAVVLQSAREQRFTVVCQRSGIRLEPA